MDLEDALLGVVKMFSYWSKMSSSWSIKEKRKNDNKTLTYIYLHFLNDIFQDVLKEKVIIELSLKLEQLCMTKSLSVNYISNIYFTLIA